MEPTPADAIRCASSAALLHGMSSWNFEKSVKAVAETIYGWSVVYETAFSAGHVDIDRTTMTAMPSSVWDPIEDRRGARIIIGIIAFLAAAILTSSFLVASVAAAAMAYITGIIMLVPRTRTGAANVVALAAIGLASWAAVVVYSHEPEQTRTLPEAPFLEHTASPDEQRESAIKLALHQQNAVDMIRLVTVRWDDPQRKEHARADVVAGLSEIRRSYVSEADTFGLDTLSAAAWDFDQREAHNALAWSFCIRGDRCFDGNGGKGCVKSFGGVYEDNPELLDTDVRMCLDSLARRATSSRR